MLRRSAREFLAKECSSKDVRKLMESPDAFDEKLAAKQTGAGWQLDGVKHFVPDDEVADYMVVVARTRGDGEDGITLFLIKGRPKGMTVTPVKAMDMTRRWTEVRFDKLQLDASSVMGSPNTAWPHLKRALEW